jgi:hypothetical protein
MEPFKNLSKSYQNKQFWAWCLQWLDFLILAPYLELFKNISKSYQKPKKTIGKPSENQMKQ